MSDNPETMDDDQLRLESTTAVMAQLEPTSG